MGCVTTVTKTLEESTGVLNVQFNSATETWAVHAGGGFERQEISRRIRKAGDEHNRRVGRAEDPAWIVNWLPGDRRIKKG